MLNVHVEITRFVADDQPGWVECRLVDAHGRVHLFAEKAPIVSSRSLDRHSSYPCTGMIACTLIDRRIDADGRELLVVDSERPYGISSREQVQRFVVRPEQLSEQAG